MNLLFIHLYIYITHIHIYIREIFNCYNKVTNFQNTLKQKLKSSYFVDFIKYLNISCVKYYLFNLI